MSGTYEVLWVGDKVREWSGQKGSTFLDYSIKVREPDGSEGSAVITRKQGGRPAPTVGQRMFGHIEEETITPKPGQNFDAFTKRKLKEDEQDGGGGSQNASQGSSGGLSRDEWAAKDRRIARAGVLQAVVGATPLANAVGMAGDRGSLTDYVAAVNTITDALIASLDERTPHPSGAGLGGGSGNSDGAADVRAASPSAPGPAAESNVARGFASTSQQDLFQRLLKDNGLDHANLMTIMAYAESLPTPAISVAIDGIKDNADDMSTRLLEAAGKWAKEHDFTPADVRDLPPAEQVGIGAADDDIPFAPSVI